MQKHVELDEPEETQRARGRSEHVRVASRRLGALLDEEGYGGQARRFEDADIEDADVEDEIDAEEAEADEDPALDEDFTEEDALDDVLAEGRVAVEEEDGEEVADTPGDEIWPRTICPVTATRSFDRGRRATAACEAADEPGGSDAVREPGGR